MTGSRQISRRAVLSLFAFVIAASAGARIIFGGRPFDRVRSEPPRPVDTTTSWAFFTSIEAAMVEAIVDRLIPTDELGIGGRDAGCAVFIDRQLAGAYGQSAVWYLAGPATAGTPQQGPQFTNSIADRYRLGLAALDRHCRMRPGGKAFASLAPAEQDALLGRLEDGTASLEGFDGKALFDQLLKNTREGYFADPLYGGNRDMAGWKMIGFPGARYDYRDMIGRRGEDLGLVPVSIYGQGLV